ncbi:MAG: hypothetical protein IT214_11985 [Chitinophagaceae bacterium]|jgi:uncharacterized protein YneF (UPF0154 family)|nr:hypothetical protein [Chitinophagaceae bacterium]OQY95955.1 MAG: hypothetical protein B6D37_04135 [Sphingobacteriales bacterium UTBCD1]
MLILLLIFAALAVGLIAGAMAYFIHYNEYQHHLAGNLPFKESLKSAIVSFIYFFAISFAVGIIMYRLFK